MENIALSAFRSEQSDTQPAWNKALISLFGLVEFNAAFDTNVWLAWVELHCSISRSVYLRNHNWYTLVTGLPCPLNLVMVFHTPGVKTVCRGTFLTSSCIIRLFLLCTKWLTTTAGEKKWQLQLFPSAVGHTHRYANIYSDSDIGPVRVMMSQLSACLMYVFSIISYGCYKWNIFFSYILEWLLNINNVMSDKLLLVHDPNWWLLLILEFAKKNKVPLPPFCSFRWGMLM